MTLQIARHLLAARLGRARVATVALAALPLAAAAVLTACGSSAPRSSEGSAAAGSNSPGAAAPAEAINLAVLREQAITLLEQSTLANSPEQRGNAIEALEPLPSRLGTVVRRGLADESAGVRAIAAAVAGRARITAVTPQIRELLNDASPFVRINALYALAVMDNRSNPAPLALWLRDPAPLVRAQAAFVIGELGNPSALPLVKEAAADPLVMSDPVSARWARLQLAEAMIKLGEYGAIHEIRAALYPASPDELAATVLAVQIIGRVRDGESIGQIIQLIRYDVPGEGRMPAEVRMAAAATAARLGRPAGTSVALEYLNAKEAPLRAQASFTLGEIGLRQNLQRLAPMLQDPDPLVQVHAAAAIVKITDGPGPTPGSIRASGSGTAAGMR